MSFKFEVTLHYKREACLIQTGTLEVEILLCSKMRQITLNVLNLKNFFFFAARNAQVTFAETTNESKQFTKTKTWISNLNLIGQSF